MANAKNKTYVVYGAQGEELETLKTLVAAKKLADAEGGSVLCDGECVYRSAVETEKANPETSLVGENSDENEGAPDYVENVDGPVEKSVIFVEKSGASAERIAPKDSMSADGKTQKYRLKTLMNVRKGPTISSAKLKTLPAGIVVKVREVKNDWLCLENGTFILFGAGKFAERIE